MCDCTSSKPPGFLPRAAEAYEEALERLKEAFQAAATLASEPPKCKLNPEAVDFNPTVNMDMTASTFAGTWSDSRGNTIYVDFYMDRHGSTQIQVVLSNLDRKEIYLKIWWSPESSNWHCGNGKLDAAGCSANQLVWQFANGTTSVWSKQDVARKSEQVFFDQVCHTSWPLSPAALILDNYDDLDSDSDSDDSVAEASAPFLKKSSFSSANSTTVNSEDEPASESDESVSWVIAARDLVAVPSSLDGIRPPPGLDQVCHTSWPLSPAALILDNYDDLDSDSDSDDSVTEVSAPFTKMNSFSSTSSTTVNSEDEPASESDESVSWVIVARDLVAVPSSLDAIRPPPGLEWLGS